MMALVNRIRILLVRQVADFQQADQVVACGDPSLGRGHGRERNQEILLAMDRQQWWATWNRIPLAAISR